MSRQQATAFDIGLLPRVLYSVAVTLAVCTAVLCQPQPLLAAPRMQEPPSDAETKLPVISADTPTEATLHTHLATITVGADAAGAPRLTLYATYDIRNETQEPIQLPLRISAAGALNPSLTQDDTPLTLTPSEDGSAVTQISIPANDQTTIALSATYAPNSQSLLRMVYPTELLRQWRGQRSIRVEVLPGSEANADGWLRIEPDTWQYGTSGDVLQLEWLFEGELPPQIVFETITPTAWQELQSLAASATGNAPAAYVALGQRYAQFSSAAAQLPDGAAQARFFAQAVAAYTEGIRQADAAGAPTTERAALHAGLAALYRERVLAAGHAADARTMVAEAGLALQGLMVDDPRRAELEQWQIEGLRLMLADLRQRGDIPGALALIEQLQSLPSGGSGAEFLEQERQALVVQQAVQLLEDGDRTTALALAGDRITDPALQPPAEYRNLFARWIVSTTMSARGVDVRAELYANEDRVEDAAATLDSMVAAWRKLPELRDLKLEVHSLDGQAAPGRYELLLQLPAGGNGVKLANILPTDADWALLRVLLSQLGPQISTQVEGLWEKSRIAQPLDLRTVGEQWKRIADELDKQAAELETTATQADGAPVEASQAARLRAANYRYAAQAWRDLEHNSQVIVSLSTPGSRTPVARTWMVTASSPPQMLNVQIETLSSTRILLAAALLLAVVFGLAALLWRLV